MTATALAPIAREPHAYWPARDQSIRLAHAVLDNGRLVQSRQTDDGDAECGPYSSPFYRWRWGRAEVSMWPSGGRWTVMLESPGVDDPSGWGQGGAILWSAYSEAINNAEARCLFGRLRMAAEARERWLRL